MKTQVYTFSISASDTQAQKQIKQLKDWCKQTNRSFSKEVVAILVKALKEQANA